MSARLEDPSIVVSELAGKTAWEKASASWRKPLPPFWLESAVVRKTPAYGDLKLLTIWGTQLPRPSGRPQDSSAVVGASVGRGAHGAMLIASRLTSSYMKHIIERTGIRTGHIDMATHYLTVRIRQQYNVCPPFII